MKNNNNFNKNVNSVDTNENNKLNGDDFMKNLIRERIAQANGVSINNKMLKKAERKDKEGEYIMAEVMTEGYNYASETMPPTTRFPELNKLRQEYLNSMKYAMYYDVWSYR